MSKQMTAASISIRVPKLSELATSKIRENNVLLLQVDSSLLKSPKPITPSKYKTPEMKLVNYTLTDTSPEEDEEEAVMRASASSSMVSLFKKSLEKRKNVYSNEGIPLNSPWTFWVDRSGRGVSAKIFESNLRHITTIYTCSKFWTSYYNLPQPSLLNVRASLHLMRDERKPMWEEMYNINGGSFRIAIHKRDTDKVWKEALIAAIGERYTDFISSDDEICGVSMSIRDNENILMIWNRSAEEAKRARIFECVRLLLPDIHFIRDQYKAHNSHKIFKQRDMALEDEMQHEFAF